MASHLVDANFEPRREPDGGAGLRLLTHELTRRLAEDEGTRGHLPRRARTMATLAETGRHFALRHDLRKLRQVPKPKAAEPNRHLVVEAGPPLAAIADAVILPDRQVLIGYRSGLMRLLGKGGRELWRGQANGLIGFVPVGEGQRVIVLRTGLDELVAMVFCADERRLAAWGALPISAWHPHATETGWPVFGRDGAFTMLDTAGLLRPRPEDAPGGDPPPLAHHWSIPMSEPGRPLALLRGEREAVLAYARLDGLVEWWSIDFYRLRVDCRFWTSPPRVGQPPFEATASEATASESASGPTTEEPFVIVGVDTISTFSIAIGTDVESRHEVQALFGADTYLSESTHIVTAADRDRELELRNTAAQAAGIPFVPMVALGPSGLWAALRHENALVWSGRANRSAPRWSVSWHGAASLAARFDAAGTAVVIHDDGGRLVMLDLDDGGMPLVLK